MPFRKSERDERLALLRVAPLGIYPASLRLVTKEGLMPLTVARCDRTKSVSLVVSTGTLRLMGHCRVLTEKIQLRFMPTIVVGGSLAKTWQRT